MDGAELETSPVGFYQHVCIYIYICISCMNRYLNGNKHGIYMYIYIYLNKHGFTEKRGISLCNSYNLATKLEVFFQFLFA